MWNIFTADAILQKIFFLPNFQQQTLKLTHTHAHAHTHEQKFDLWKIKFSLSRFFLVYYVIPKKKKNNFDSIQKFIIVIIIIIMDPIKLMNSSHTYYNEPQLEALPFYPWQIILIMIYSTTAFISLGSNALTIIILLRNEQVSTELWKFLLNLSISDITMALFCIPFTYTNYMLGRWIFPHFLCPIIPFFQVTAVSVSIWTLTIIGIDRYVCVYWLIIYLYIVNAFRHTNTHKQTSLEIESILIYFYI